MAVDVRVNCLNLLIADLPRSTGSCTKESSVQDNSCNSDYRRVLPPPPDVRNVVMTSQVVTQSVVETVSSGNTTVIGDYVAAAFQQHDRKWLVQATGNATIQSTILGIRNNKITMDRHYIFIILGHNQIQTAEKGAMQQLHS